MISKSARNIAERLLDTSLGLEVSMRANGESREHVVIQLASLIDEEISLVMNSYREIKRSLEIILDIPKCDYHTDGTTESFLEAGISLRRAEDIGI